TLRLWIISGDCSSRLGDIRCLPSLGEADLKKKGDATGRSSVCSLFHIDKVGVTSATKFWTQYGRDPLS
ncbi:hypothetical protein NPIL_696512, partial [Nephila pilipes]